MSKKKSINKLIKRSVRLSKETVEKIKKAAKIRGLTESEVIRLWLEARLKYYRENDEAPIKINFNISPVLATNDTSLETENNQDM